MRYVIKITSYDGHVFYRASDETDTFWTSYRDKAMLFDSKTAIDQDVSVYQNAAWRPEYELVLEPA
jgi:hypothetical protein